LEQLDEELRKEIVDQAAEIIRLAKAQGDTATPSEG